ncbi:hypothetical protein [Pseudokineococcus sp. 1T1Z-3]|uniref:hypothetical protein n=1 Tax=Pseudokineococcus sp. 1T1Z-3 TaxID=3132745 RepID=UPI003099F8C8
MSREVLGGPGAAPTPASESAGRHLVEDLDQPEQPVEEAAPRRRVRQVGALVVAAGLGAGGGALLATRGGGLDDVRLLATTAYPYGSSAEEDGGPQELSVATVLVNGGEEEVTVEGGWLGPGPQDLPLRVRGDGALTSPLRLADRDQAEADQAEADPVVLEAGGSALVTMTVSASCDDLPAWEPRLAVRTATGAAGDVDLRQLEDLYSPGGSVEGGGPLAEACEVVALGGQGGSATVVSHELTAEGVDLQVQVEGDVPLELAVASGGAAGVSLPDGPARLEPGAATTVALRVDPPDCAAALALDDVTEGLDLRLSTAGGDAPSTQRWELWQVQTPLSFAAGRACPAG